MRVRKTPASAGSGFAAALLLALLPLPACALANAPAGPTQPKTVSTPGATYNPGFAVVPGFAPAIDSVWLTNPSWRWPFAAPDYRSLAATPFSDDAGSLAFDIGDYDALWDDTWFSEIAAYGGLQRDALRIAGMRAMNGADGASGGIPYGRLTLHREFQDGQQTLGLGAYGLNVSVQPTAISGFGNDSYIDVAVDGTWRWTVHPERSTSDTISAHVLILHEGENLIASHAIFGTARTDDLTVFRTDASWSWGASFTPMIQYFQVTGSSDPVRLGTLDGIPDSKGWIAQIAYLPPDNAASPFSWFPMRLSLQFVAYSEFDGSSQNASHSNAILFHLSAGGDPD